MSEIRLAANQILPRVGYLRILGNQTKLESAQMVINSSTRQTGLQILRDTSIAFFVVFFSFSTFAMGDRPEVDPQCFASDKLRVEIGGKRYEFPREMVRSMRGSSVSDTRHNDHGTTAFGYSACQKPGDVYWKLDSLDIKAIPLKCSDKKECYVKSIYLHIADIDYRRNRNPSDNIYPNDKISLLKECKAPVEPFNREHARTWSSCNYQLYTEEKYIGLTFRGGIYPPDKIDQTVQLVLKEIQKYEIKN